MWTSQVYGHHDKMTGTKTHRTLQNTEYTKSQQTLRKTLFLCSVLTTSKLNADHRGVRAVPLHRESWLGVYTALDIHYFKQIQVRAFWYTLLIYMFTKHDASPAWLYTLFTTVTYYNKWIVPQLSIMIIYNSP